MRHLIPSISRLKAHYYKHSPSKSPGLRGIRQLVHGLTATALTPVLFPAPLIVQQAKSPSLPVPFASSNSKGSIIAAAHRPRCRVAWRRSLTGGGVHARGGVDAGPKRVVRRARRWCICAERRRLPSARRWRCAQSWRRSEAAACNHAFMPDTCASAASTPVMLISL
jgi:hypothetical protein